MNEKLSEIVVSRFFEYRYYNGVSYREAAKDIGVDHSYLANIDAKRKKPSPRTIGKMAEYLEQRSQKRR